MELTLHDTFVDEIKNSWNDLLAQSATHVPFMRYEYLKTWWETRGGGEWPQDAHLSIITIREGDRLVGIAPLFSTEWENISTLLLVGSIEISDYLDLIARPEDLPAFLDALLPYLQSERGKSLPEWQRIELYNVLETSPSLKALQEAAERHHLNFHQEPFRPSLSISLPGDWEAYLGSIDKKQRHEIRRKMRRAENSAVETGVPVRWYIVKDADTLDAEIDAFLGLMEQDPEKARFLTPPMRECFRATIRCAFQEDCLMLAFLEINGKKTAGYLNFDYLDQLWVYNSGMDRGYNEYSPGWVLLKWANENGKTHFDFMRGDEDYKFRFGAKKRDVMRATLAQPA